MTIHHGNLLHYTHPNNGDTPRRALVYQIAAGDARLLGGNFYKVWPVYLHGSDPLVRPASWMVRLSACPWPFATWEGWTGETLTLTETATYD